MVNFLSIIDCLISQEINSNNYLIFHFRSIRLTNKTSNFFS